MLFIYILFVIIFLIGIRFTKDNPDYLKKDTTTIINGMFVITIFFSHFVTYITKTNMYDEYLISILHFIGQLMVTSFLFYSGYGIYEGIKNKKDYISSFFRKRFIPTFINFAIAIVLYIIVNLIIGNTYSIKEILLAFIGYESIGNSNWYMLAIFALYIFIIICFNNKIKTKNIYRLMIFTLLTGIYIFVISRFKDNYYVDTVLCFPIGMWYSYFKDKIDSVLVRRYLVCLISSIILLIGSYYLTKVFYNVYSYNIFAVFFIIFIVVLTRKVKIKSSIITFFGIHTFWIYILQRIPMMIFKDKLNNYVYFIICFIITIGLSYLLKRLTDKLWKKNN